MCECARQEWNSLSLSWACHPNPSFATVQDGEWRSVGNNWAAMRCAPWVFLSSAKLALCGLCAETFPVSTNRSWGYQKPKRGDRQTCVTGSAQPVWQKPDRVDYSLILLICFGEAEWKQTAFADLVAVFGPPALLCSNMPWGNVSCSLLPPASPTPSLCCPASSVGKPRYWLTVFGLQVCVFLPLMYQKCRRVLRESRIPSRALQSPVCDSRMPGNFLITSWKHTFYWAFVLWSFK